jgi:hypothetical protein
MYEYVLIAPALSLDIVEIIVNERGKGKEKIAEQSDFLCWYCSFKFR